MMKSKFSVLSSTVAVVCLSLPAFGDDTARTDNKPADKTIGASPSPTSEVPNTAVTTGRTSSPWFEPTKDNRPAGNVAIGRTSSQIERLGSTEKSSKVIGWEVRNTRNEKLGKIEDLAIDMESGRIVHAIVGSGGFLGIGEKYFAVPPNALSYDAAQEVVLLNMDKERFKSAPAFELSRWDEYTAADKLAEVYRYYGQPAYWGTTSSLQSSNSTLNQPSSVGGTSSTTTSGTTSSSTTATRDQNNVSGQGGTSGSTTSAHTSDASKEDRSTNDQSTTPDRAKSSTGTTSGSSDTPGSTTSGTTSSDTSSSSADRVTNANEQRTTASTTTDQQSQAVGSTSSRTTDQIRSSSGGLGSSPASSTSGSSVASSSTLGSSTSANQNWTTSSYSQLGHVDRAKKIVGMPVKNMQQERVGKVDNLIVDLAAGRVVSVVVSTGGFLGMGDTLSAVPPQAFRASTDRDALMLDVTKDKLANYPHFTATQWPQFNDPNYVSGVYRSYNVNPYFTGTGAADVDNTRRNIRDRNDQTLTPMDQGNNSSDVQTTAQLRRAITRESGFSMNARNIKIITANGRTTLRGVVDSDAERNRIEELAKQAVPNGNIDNQLEVQQSTSRDNR